MSIEIKQLVIKSSIVDEEDDGSSQEDVATTNIKQEVLSECRRMIIELLNEKGLR